MLGRRRRYSRGHFGDHSGTEMLRLAGSSVIQQAPMAIENVRRATVQVLLRRLNHSYLEMKTRTIVTAHPAVSTAQSWEKDSDVAWTMHTSVRQVWGVQWRMRGVQKTCFLKRYKCTFGSRDRTCTAVVGISFSTPATWKSFLHRRP